MRDGSIYAAISRAQDPEGYDALIEEVQLDLLEWIEEQERKEEEESGT